ncbi:MAG: hypothetical protein K1X74_23280 [Pirellulales bacterium]|nr:hypothetical protein [Pirellulales bacterium]
MVIAMAEVFGSKLQGRLLGKKHYARLCELLSDVPPGEIVFLDFSGVDLVTGSWVNAMIVPFFRWAADEGNDVFPVICNAQEGWLDDLTLVADWTHQCYLVATGNAPARTAVLVGSLDPGQRNTLNALLELQEATGAALERLRPDENIKATAWNNRLKDLYDKRLLRRERRGREQVYTPVIAEVVSDGRQLSSATDQQFHEEAVPGGSRKKKADPARPSRSGKHPIPGEPPPRPTTRKG